MSDAAAAASSASCAAVASRRATRGARAAAGPSAGARSRDAEVERYSRQLVLPGVGRGGAASRCAEASVLVVGAGRARARRSRSTSRARASGGSGSLDDDAVELSNLHRQLLHFTPDLGVPKAESAAAKLRFLNPDIVVEPYQVRVDEDNAAALVAGQDLVVDCSDSFATRYAVNAACCAAGVPLVEGGVLGHGRARDERSGRGGPRATAAPSRAPPADAPTLRRRRRARAGRGRDRLAAGARGAEAADRRRAGRLPTASCRSTSRAREFLRVHAARRAGLPGLRRALGCRRMLGLGTLRRVAGELRRDVAAAHERDPAARGVSSLEILAAWPGVQALLAHRVAHALRRGGVPLAPRAARAASRARSRTSRSTRARRDRRRPVHRPRHGRRDRRDGRGRRQRDDVPGRDARRHRLRDRQAPPDGAGQRDDRLGRQAARADHDRPRRQDRRQLGRDPRRAAELDRGRRPRPSRCASRAARPEGPDADWAHLPDPIADARQACCRRASPSSSAGSPSAEGAPAPAEVVPLRPRRGPDPAGG